MICRKKWPIKIIVLLILVGGLFLCRFPILRGMGNYLVSEDGVRTSDAFFILGGNSFERGLEAIQVYRQFPSARFVATGGNFPLQIQAFDTMMTEAALTRHFMIRRGVPDSLIAIIEQSTSTFEESDEILNYCKKKGYRQITLISSSFHLRRMRWVFEKKFRKNNITVFFHGANDSTFDQNEWWKHETNLITCNNEYVKLMYYFFKYGW